MSLVEDAVSGTTQCRFGSSAWSLRSKFEAVASWERYSLLKNLQVLSAVTARKAASESRSHSTFKSRCLRTMAETCRLYYCLGVSQLDNSSRNFWYFDWFQVPGFLKWQSLEAPWAVSVTSLRESRPSSLYSRCERLRRFHLRALDRSFQTDC